MPTAPKMEMHWRSRSPKSAAPASSSRREPTFPDRSGKTAASSGRSGERDSCSAAAHREDGVGRIGRRRIERGDGSPSSGEETAFRSKRWRKKQRHDLVRHWIPRSLLVDCGGDAKAALRASGRSGERASSSAAAHSEDEVERIRQRRIERDGSPSSAEETAFRSKRWPKKQRHDVIRHWIPRSLLIDCRGDVKAALRAYLNVQNAGRKEGFLYGEPPKELGQSALHARHSSSQSGDAQEEALFDLEERNSLLKMDKKPKPFSGDPGKEAQDEDEDGYSDKKPLNVVEDEHSDKIVAHATDEDHKQEQGRSRGNVQDLLNMDDETLSRKIVHLRDLLNDVSVRDCYTLVHNDDQLIELYQQQALYRIRAYELKVNRKLPKLDDVVLKREYPPSILWDKGFFRHYEESLEWYFDPELCWCPHFDNYQRLVLSEGGYFDGDYYRSILNTYEEDLAYVQFYEALANTTKWIEDYLGDSTIKQDKIKGVARMQSLEAAAGFPNVCPLLVFHGFDEYFNSICYDYSNKRLCDLYFEIWKLVASGKMSFEEALLEVNELENTRDISRRKDDYDAHVAGIDKMASDDEARQLIIKAIIRMDPKPKYYLDYAKKKLDIAKNIGLAPKGYEAEEGVPPLGKGDNVEARVEEIED